MHCQPSTPPCPHYQSHTYVCLWGLISGTRDLHISSHVALIHLGPVCLYASTPSWFLSMCPVHESSLTHAHLKGRAICSLLGQGSLRGQPLMCSRLAALTGGRLLCLAGSSHAYNHWAHIWHRWQVLKFTLKRKPCPADVILNLDNTSHAHLYNSTVINTLSTQPTKK